MASASVILPTRIDIRDFIVAHFSREELAIFCAEYFGDVYSGYEGTAITLQKWALELVTYCERFSMTENLCAALYEKREKSWIEKFGLSSNPTAKKIRRNPHQVFISYATASDSVIANQIAADLRLWDVPVWIAPASLKPGDKWIGAIGRGMQESGIFVLLLSPAAVASEWVKLETEEAIDMKVRGEMKLIALDYQACDWDLLTPFVKRFQAISFRENYETGLRDLRAALGAQPPLIERLKTELSAAKQRIDQLQAELHSARQHSSQADPATAEIASLKAKIAVLTSEVQTKDTVLLTAQTELRKAQAQIDQLKTELNTANAVKTAPTGPNLSPNPDRIVIETPIWLELVRVPAGEFLMGSDPDKDPNASDDEKPQHRVRLSEYYIGKTPVTNAQYAVFAKATNLTFNFPKGKEQHPVVNVSWRDAMTFCEWLTAQTKQAFRLPTEAEWEKAARGSDGRVYPWVGGVDAQKCNTDEGKIGDTTPVGKYSPVGDSPYGCVDMAGNVWEWCVDAWDSAAYAKRVNQEIISKIIGYSNRKVVRGGSWYYDGSNARAAVRIHNHTDIRYDDRGFRLVSSAPLFSTPASV